MSHRDEKNTSGKSFLLKPLGHGQQNASKYILHGVRYLENLKGKEWEVIGRFKFETLTDDPHLASSREVQRGGTGVITRIPEIDSSFKASAFHSAIPGVRDSFSVRKT